MSDRPEDREAFDILEDYLDRLHAGESPDRARLLKAYPNLASALDCLDILESFAPEHGAETAEGERETGSSVNDIAGIDFGPYRLLEEIGRGGMGVVYKARQKALDRTVAIKMILANHLASHEHVRRFQAEARAAARLQHANIVHIHDVGQLHGQHYFAMEFIDGASLADRIARGPLDLAEAARIVGLVARAVAHLHEQGIVHRDLKPSNILLDAQGQPYVTDFGLARFFSGESEQTATGVIAGTPSYMSPEQAAGRRDDIGPASDIYNLGAILYELLTGHPPFREENPLDTLMQVLSREPVLPRDWNPRIPRSLELICMKCLAKNPSGRYASAEALAEDLDRFSRGEALEARSPHLGQRFLRWLRRKPALAARLGALGAFYVVETVNYSIGNVDATFHRHISLLVLLWAIASVIFQKWIDSRRWSVPAQFGWGMLDSAVLLAVLLLADGAASSLVVGYPLLIVGSSLWFRVRFVTFMTVLSLLSYGVLIVDFYVWRPQLQARFDPSLNRHVIFALSLVVLGLIVAHLVQRVRDLSDYFGRK